MISLRRTCATIIPLWRRSSMLSATAVAPLSCSTAFSAATAAATAADPFSPATAADLNYPSPGTIRAGALSKTRRVSAFTNKENALFTPSSMLLRTPWTQEANLPPQSALCSSNIAASQDSLNHFQSFFYGVDKPAPSWAILSNTSKRIFRQAAPPPLRLAWPKFSGEYRLTAALVAARDSISAISALRLRTFFFQRLPALASCPPKALHWRPSTCAHAQFLGEPHIPAAIS